MDPLFVVFGGGGVVIAWLVFLVSRNIWRADKAWFKRMDDLQVVAPRMGLHAREVEEDEPHPLLRNSVFAAKWTAVPTYVMSGRLHELDVAVLEVTSSRRNSGRRWRTAVAFRSTGVRWPHLFIVPLTISYDPTDLDGFKKYEMQDVGGEFEGEYSLWAADASAVERVTSEVKRRLLDAESRGEPTLIEATGDRFVVHSGLDSVPADKLPDVLAKADAWQQLFAEVAVTPTAAPAPVAVAAPAPTVLPAKFCPHCGTPLGGPARFCPQCGKPL